MGRPDASYSEERTDTGDVIWARDYWKEPAGFEGSGGLNIVYDSDGQVSGSSDGPDRVWLMQMNVEFDWTYTFHTDSFAP